MKRPPEEFWHSTFAHVIKMIDMYADELQMQISSAKNGDYQSKYFGQQEVREIKSMKEIEGW